METFLEIVQEILNGIIRATSAHYFQKHVLEHQKTTPRRSKQRGGSDKT